MSTRSLIAMQLEDDKYKTIYCHFDGYLSHNGALLLDYYNTTEIINELLELGNISCLAKNLYPDPTMIHGFGYNERQEDVVVAYGRERGEKNTEAIILSYKELTDEYGDADYIYVFTQDNKWMYLKPDEHNELQSVEEDLKALYLEKGLTRPNDYYGYLDDDIVEELKNICQIDESEMEVQ